MGISMKAKFLIAVILVAVTGAPAYAQRESRTSSSSSIKVVASGVQCTSNPSEGFDVYSWSWGASNSIDLGSGISPGKASLAGVTLLRNFDQCSPSLFQFSVIGKHFTLLTLLQTNSGDNKVTTEVRLSDVVIENYQLSSSSGMNVPSESISLRFRKIQITPTGGGTKICFDATMNAVCDQTF